MDEMIPLCQRATDAGIWTGQIATQHIARVELLRAKSNADFRELISLYERAKKKSYTGAVAVNTP